MREPNVQRRRRAAGRRIKRATGGGPEPGCGGTPKRRWSAPTDRTNAKGDDVAGAGSGRGAARSERDELAVESPASGRPRERELIAIYEAALAVGSELDLATVLQRIVDVARTVVPAHYAALGVAGKGYEIVRFITSGITPAERARLGPPPRGHGLLGELIRVGKPLLIDDMSKDPRAVGFPPGHPPMRSLLGVPILLGSRPLGNLYLSERENGTPFDEDDLAAVQLLAVHAAAAIDRAQLYREVEASRRQAEAQRDQLRAILDSLPSGVLIERAPDATIELANAAAGAMIFNGEAPVAGGPVHGRDFRWRQADGSPLADDLRPGSRAMRGLLVLNHQLGLERGDGRTLPVLAQAAPLRDLAGEITGAVVVIQDVTRLREAEQLKDDFLALVSHEFRTPLTAIHGGAHLLSRQGDQLDDETRGELLTDIAQESERLDAMLRNMLDLAAIMAGRLMPRREPLSIGPVARRVAAEVGARSPRHHFVVSIEHDLPAASGDEALLAQVLRNVYENAVKYAPAGGEVRVTAARGEGELTLHVTDWGSGIAAEHVPHVFERFRRPGADPTTRGMGLGLYLSRLLIEALGGRITASSPGPGLGATFSVSLPVAGD